jgi:DNA-binding NtrC family response regulator
MKPSADIPIVVVDEDKEQCNNLCDMLTERQYQTIPIYIFHDLNKYLQENPCLTVIIDLNIQAVDIHVIKKLTTNFPEVSFIGLTRHRLNPELQEIICYHMSACFTKPVTLEDLCYLIESIYEDSDDKRNQP